LFLFIRTVILPAGGDLDSIVFNRYIKLLVEENKSEEVEENESEE